MGVRDVLVYLKGQGWELRPDQRRILPTLLRESHFCLLWNMRLGKTLPVCIAAEVKGKNVLIVAPPKVLATGVWDKNLNIINASDKFDIISSGRLTKEYEDQLLTKDYDFVIIDELHQYRGNTQRTRILSKITSKADVVIGLTGTPFDKNLHEIFYPWKLLDGGELFGTNRTNFNNTYCMKEDPYDLRSDWVLRPEMYNLIVDAIKPNMDRVLKKEEIIEPETIIHNYNLTDTQKELYRDLDAREPIEFFDDENVEFKGGVIKEKKYQLCSGFLLHTFLESDPSGKLPYIEDKVVMRGIPTYKWDLFRELIEKETKKFVIWVRYIEEYRLVLENVGSKRVKRFTPTSLKMLESGVLDGIVAHPRSAGVGVDISCADAAYFVTETPSNIDQSQARARLSVLGGTDRKTLHYMVAYEPQSKKLRNKMKEKRAKMETFLDERYH